MFICNQQNKEFSQFLIEFAKETLLANVGVLCRNLSATYGGGGRHRGSFRAPLIRLLETHLNDLSELFPRVRS